MWTESFFDETTLEFWRQACPPAQTEAELKMMETMGLVEAGSRVLDLPCGLGRHALALAVRGCRVTAQDSSEYALEQLSKEARSREVEIDIRCAEMREIPERSVFDTIICMGNSLGYFDARETTEYICKVGRALKPEGRFLLESSIVAESLLPTWDERNWIEVGDFLLLIENRYRLEESCVETTFTFLRRGERSEKIAHHHVFTIRQLSEMLKEGGLDVLGLYSSVTLDPFEVGSDRLFLLAERRP